MFNKLAQTLACSGPSGLEPEQNNTMAPIKSVYYACGCCSVVPSAGEKTEFHMEELRRITNAGTKTPVYLLCLTELKRLTQVGGSRNTSVYKLSTHN